MAPGRESSPNQGRLKLDPTGSSLLRSSSWPLFRAFLISLFGTKTNGLTNTCGISREEVLHRPQGHDQTLGPQVLSGVRSKSRLSSLAGGTTSWLGFALRGRPSPPTCSSILPTLFKTGTVVPVLTFSWLFYFWDIAGLLQPEQRRLDCPPLGRAPSPARSSHHTPKSTRKQNKRGFYFSTLPLRLKLL